MSFFQSRRSHRILDESDLDVVEPGSLLEILRNGYSHWAVYIGDREVCHFTVASEMVGSFMASIACVNSGKGKVIIQPFSEMLGDERAKVFVNNSSDSRWSPLPSEEIISRAKSAKGKVLTYRVVHFNCEHFAHLCRYGVSESNQAQGYLSLLFGGLVATVVGGPAAVVGMAAAAVFGVFKFLNGGSQN